MASFNGFVLTNKGRELLAKAVAGETLTFTKMQIGDGTFTGDIKTLTALVNKKDDFNINQIENQGNGQVVLKAIINNQSTVTGYYIREIGMFAHGDDNVEVLYAYNKSTEADYFPAFNGSNAVEFEYHNIIIVDQAQNVTAVIDPSLTYITKEEAEIRMLESLGYLAGGEYAGILGTDLKEIKKGKTYLYIDSSGNKAIYKAIRNNTSSTGFIIPTSADFVNITNSFLYDRVKAYRTGTNKECLIWQIDDSVHVTLDGTVAPTYVSPSIGNMYEYVVAVGLPFQIKKAAAFGTITADIGGVAEYLSNMRFNKESANIINVTFESPVNNLGSVSLSIMVVGSV